MATLKMLSLITGGKCIRSLIFNAPSVVPSLRRYSDEVTASRSADPDPAKKTVFDLIIEKRIPADVIYEDERCIAFNDVNPQAPSHFLVIPKERIATLGACETEHAQLLSHLMLTAKNLANSRLPGGYRLVINNGKDAAQSVYHLHIHILGGRQMGWPPG